MGKINVTGQRPQLLSTIIPPTMIGTFDPVKLLEEKVVDPIFTPLGTNPPSLTHDGIAIDKDFVLSTLINCLQKTKDQTSEDIMRDIFAQTLVSYDGSTPLSINETYVIQVANNHRTKLPHPGPTTLYTAGTDIIPSAKKLLMDDSDENRDIFFASLGYTYAPKTLGFWFLNSNAFDEFIKWAETEFDHIRNMPTMPSDTISLMDKFFKITLPHLTEGLMLRKAQNDGNHEYSFPRVITSLLMRYCSPRNNVIPPAGAMPFNMSEAFVPESIVFVNVERHARSNPRKVDNEWRLINATLASGVRVISNKNLSKLTALPRALSKAYLNAQRNQVDNTTGAVGRSAHVKFRKRPPTSVDISAGILRVLKRMKKVNHSRNVFRKVKTSYLKASRRDPDNYNIPGRIFTQSYLPDLHIFVDTSGSISEENYQDAVVTIIKIAKKLNVDVYFNSFSHILSQETLLKTANKSVSQCYREFERVPKVSGGTDYEQIWEYICASKKRRERFSLMITDFEYYPPSNRVEHPMNLYYAPCSRMNWDVMMHYAKKYASQMRHIEPAIASRLIGITQ